MRSSVIVAAGCAATLGLATQIAAQRGAQPAPPDPVKPLVERLDLERYKTTFKGLTQFGDRRQGTDRNRAAVDWIEAQLKSYGCANVERLKYEYKTPPPQPGRGGQTATAAARGAGADNVLEPLATSAGGGRPRGIRTR